MQSNLNKNNDPKIIVALDYADADSALKLVNQLDPALCRLKVGKELFTAAGPQFVEKLSASNFGVFLDLKFHDIPSTVKKACEAASHLGVWMINVHASGGSMMLEAALEGVNKAISKAEESFKGLVIANEGPNFSAGANVGMIFMLAIEQEYDELDMAIRMFQNTMMRARYSSIPVVVAPHGLTLGGACELSLHADKVCPAAETYTGLVELGVGLIPGGGGTKEFVLRAADDMHEDEPETITLKNRFLSIATAKECIEHALQRQCWRQGRCRAVLRPVRHRQNHPVGRRKPLPDR